jgi:hypothetical protein
VNKENTKLTNKFQYILFGAGITLLAILGAFTLLFSGVQAGESIYGAADDNPPQQLVSEMKEQSNVAPPVFNEGEVLPTDNDVLISERTTYEFEFPGTIDAPETNISVIVHIVKELARKQEELLLGQVGWLQVIMHSFIPANQRVVEAEVYLGPDISVRHEAIIPQSPQYEFWYHLNEAGSYDEAIGRIMDLDGKVYQESILIEGRWANLTFRDLGVPAKGYIVPHSTTPPLGISQEANFLEIASTWTGTSMEAYQNNGQYKVTVYEMYEEPVNDMILQDLVMGLRQTMVFDMKSGHYLSKETEILLKDNTWVLRERWDFPTAAFFKELPEELTRLFYDAIRSLAEEN